MQARPENRMVADVLEAEWNAKLRALDEARRELEERRSEPDQGLGEQQRQRVLALATDFPRLWNDPSTPHRERKRMARLLIEDVTLTRGNELLLGVRLRGGATRRLTLAPDRPAHEVYKTPGEVVAEIDRLLEDHTDAEIATILNERDYQSGYGHAFHKGIVWKIRTNYALRSRFERLRARGLLTIEEIAERLTVSTWTIKKWRKRGLLHGHAYNDKPCRLYELPEYPPTKREGGSISRQLLRSFESALHRANEVQYEA